MKSQPMDVDRSAAFIGHLFSDEMKRRRVAALLDSSFFLCFLPPPAGHILHRLCDYENSSRQPICNHLRVCLHLRLLLSRRQVEAAEGGCTALPARY